MNSQACVCTRVPGCVLNISTVEMVLDWHILLWSSEFGTLTYKNSSSQFMDESVKCLHILSFFLLQKSYNRIFVLAYHWSWNVKKDPLTVTITDKGSRWTLCLPSTNSGDVSIASISFIASSELMSCQFWQSVILSLRPFPSRRTLETDRDTIMTSPLLDIYSEERAVGENSEAHWTRHPEVICFFFLSSTIWIAFHIRASAHTPKPRQLCCVLATNGKNDSINCYYEDPQCEHHSKTNETWNEMLLCIFF